DAGTAFSGAVITPFYDSLLVKVTAHGLRFEDAARRMERCLQEFRVRGVKTNIPFLLNLVTDEEFLKGHATTKFLDERPQLLHFTRRKDRATKILSYIGDVIVNGHPEIKNRRSSSVGEPTPPHKSHESYRSHASYEDSAPPGPVDFPRGTRDELKARGPEGF